jgi:hypothetical protein
MQVIDLKYSSGAIATLLVVLPTVLTGQKAPMNAVPLKNWATPLYWQPNQAERETFSQASSQKAAPQIVFSSNATSNTALVFVAITPCRLVDTRGSGGGFVGVTPFDGPSLAAGGTMTVPVQSSSQTSTTAPAPCGAIPSIAQAYSFNLTVVPTGVSGSSPGGAVDFVSIWPAGATRPIVATLNDPGGLIAANAAIVPAGPTGSPNYGGVDVFNNGPSSTDIVIDMNGYFAAPTDASLNTAIGSGSLLSNTTGDNNTATGANALLSNTGGSDNTANGTNALLSNTSGNFNLANGPFALQSNTSGSYNIANGYLALGLNTTGLGNTASGALALESNTTGNNNTGTGYQALSGGATGSNNTAHGYQALESNSGTNNVASGFQALQLNTTGMQNTAAGAGALINSLSGSNNIALGYQAGYNVLGSNNIHIGNTGVSGDSGVIRIGSASQTSFFAPAVNAAVSGVAVLIDTATGQLGVAPSSRRFKEDIQDMGDASSGLLRLHPVTFRYKQPFADGSKPIEFGLIAEEVADVYPDLVARSADGQIETVKYQVLDSMLLNEVQKQSEQNRQQTEEIRQQAQQIHLLEDRLAALESLLPAAPAPVR